ncbi:MAG: folate-binding protein [Rhodospirillales bacterium]|nr:folate-binding protein [Rhodospirillales bacterium]
MDLRLAALQNRGLIRISGEDAREFLQGVISNDIGKLSPERAIYAAFLTAQGKFLHDFFVFEMAGDIWLDCEGERAADLAKRLSIYRLRSQVVIEAVADTYTVAALFGDRAVQAAGLTDQAGTAGAFENGIAFVDPRLAEAGVRLVLPVSEVEAAIEHTGAAQAGFEDYDSHRIALGLPDGSRDMVVEKTILLEAGFDELNGIDWDKGCFLGQELTARTKYRGLVKRRLAPVTIDGRTPEPGTPIMAGEKEAGEIRSSTGDWAMALLRLEHLRTGTELSANGEKISLRIPGWMVL